MEGDTLRVDDIAEAAWTDGRVSRRGTMLIVMVSLITVQCLDRDQKFLWGGTGALGYIFTVAVAWIAGQKLLEKLPLHIRQFIFHIIVMTFSICGMLRTLSEAMYPELPGSNGMNLELAKRLSQGYLPADLFVAMFFPNLMCSAGMNPRWVRLLVPVQSGIFLMIFMAIYHRTPSNLVGEYTDEDLKMIRYNLVSDSIGFVGATAISFITCVPNSEKTAVLTSNYINLLMALRKADSILNHVLKNSIAGAATRLEIQVQQVEMEGHLKSQLSHVLHDLQKSMHWCVQREVFMNLTAGTYVSKMTHSMGAFLLVLNDTLLFQVSSLDTHETQSSVTVVDNTKHMSILFDGDMARLAVENLVRNALVHGSGGVMLVTAIEEVGKGISLVISVENKVIPGTINPSELQSLGQPAIKSGHGMHTASLSKTPTGLGLHHAALACRGAGGSFSLQMGKDGTSVIARVVIPAKKQALARSSSLDDPPAATAPALHEPLCVCAIDDSKIICKGYEKLLIPQLGRHRGSFVCCPKSQKDVDEFVMNAAPTGIEAANASPDIALLDQNIELRGGDIAFGTDVAKALRKRNFEGLIIIRSANDSTKDIATYTENGAVDGCLSKTESYSQVAVNITAAYVQKKRSRDIYEKSRPNAQADSVSKRKRLSHSRQ